MSHIIKTIMMLFYFLSVQLIWAENQLMVSESGLVYTMTINAYAFTPQDTLSIQYSIKNVEHRGIMLITPSSRLGEIAIQRQDGMVIQENNAWLPAETRRYLSPLESLDINRSVDLSSYSLERSDAVTSMAALDGDTLNVVGKLMTQSFGIDKLGLETEVLQRWELANGSARGDANFDSDLDIDENHLINSRDLESLKRNLYILNWESIPNEAEISTRVYIREISADINRNGEINFEDFIFFAKAFGASFDGENYDARSDLDGNGEINFQDFLLFVQYYLEIE